MLGLLAGTALTFVALRYHVVRHDEGVSLVPRDPQPPLRSIYSDVREWGVAMWEKHPEVAQALMANEQIDLISDESLDEVSLQVNELYQQNVEKLHALLTEYRTERARAAIAEVDTTAVSIEESGSTSGVTIGRFPEGMFQNAGPEQQVPIVEEPQAPAQQPASPPAPFRNPFDFQQRRSQLPSVGVDSAVPSASDAVAVRSRDPWLPELAQVSQEADSANQSLISSVPAAFQAASGDDPAPEGWLPGLLSSLIATDGETMNGQAQPSTLDVGLEPPAADGEQAFEPEALHEPIIQVRPF